MEAEVLNERLVEKSTDIVTAIQVVRFSGHLGISVRDFSQKEGERRPRKQGIWIPLSSAEQVAYAITEMKALADTLEQGD